MIDEQAVQILFQPVVHLATRSVVGFEALLRGPAGSALENPLTLLHAAAAAGRLGELDWLCRAHALRAAREANLHPDLTWLINVEPVGLATECPPHLTAGPTHADSQLRVVLELVERDLTSHVTDLLHATDQARNDGWGVAVDDVGAHESSLALLPLLRPDVVKLDLSLLHGQIEHGGAAITAAVQAYAERTGAVIVAEGVETERQEQLAVVLGATYAQGFRYGPPARLPAAVPPPDGVIPLRQRLVPPAGSTPFEVLATCRPPRRAAPEHLDHIRGYLEREVAAESDVSVLLVQRPYEAAGSASAPQRHRPAGPSTALTVVLGPGRPTIHEAGFHSRPVSPTSRLAAEQTVIVIGPYHAAAFSFRPVGTGGQGQTPSAEFVFTHDRDAVVAAARAFLGELQPTGAAVAS